MNPRRRRTSARHDEPRAGPRSPERPRTSRCGGSPTRFLLSPFPRPQRDHSLSAAGSITPAAPDPAPPLQPGAETRCRAGTRHPQLRPRTWAGPKARCRDAHKLPWMRPHPPALPAHRAFPRTGTSRRAFVTPGFAPRAPGTQGKPPLSHRRGEGERNQAGKTRSHRPPAPAPNPHRSPRKPRGAALPPDAGASNNQKQELKKKKTRKKERKHVLKGKRRRRRV